MRLIDADALIERLLESRREETETTLKLERFIKKQPTIEPKPTVTGKLPVTTLDTVFKNEASNINTASYDRDVVGITIPTAPLEAQPYVGKDINVPIKHGRWTERQHFYNDEEMIDEWQMERCSVCDRYLTTPYRYYFFHHNYCPYCGARMEKENESDQHSRY